MPPGSRLTRKRPAETDAKEQVGAAAPEESLWDSLLNGRDPKRNGVELARAQPSSIDGVVCDAEEQPLYILTEVQHISLFFPTCVTRDRKNNLLLDWEWLKLLPPDTYILLYALCVRSRAASVWCRTPS